MTATSWGWTGELKVLSPEDLWGKKRKRWGNSPLTVGIIGGKINFVQATEACALTKQLLR